MNRMTPTRVSARVGLVLATAALLGTTPFPAEFELATLTPASGGDGSAGTIFEGAAAGDRSGIAVTGAGDINGDGIDDLLVGAHRADPGGLDSAGQAYVVYGRPGGYAASFDLATLLPASGGDGSDGFVLSGFAPGQFAGEDLAIGADLNADGIEDLVIGAPQASSAGQAYIIYGSATGFPAEIDLGSLAGGDGSVGTVIVGADSADRAGVVAVGGDFNGDTIDDLVLGAPRADPLGRTRAGEAYVIYGSPLGLGATFELAALFASAGGDGTTGTVFLGINPFDEAGSDVDFTGDVNGDGIDDLIVGAPEASGTLPMRSGEAYLLFGRSALVAEVELRSLLPDLGGDGSVGTVLLGSVANATAGFAVAGAGDINGDGLKDIAVSAPGLGDGRVYVYFGRDTGFPATFGLEGLAPESGGAGVAGFVLDGEADADVAGRSLSCAGDLNDDGADDLAIGAFLASPGGRTNAGSTYIVYGRSSPFPPALALGSLRVAAGGDGTVGFAINGIDTGDGAGRSIAPAGDVDFDGIDDLLIGADTADPAARDGAGESYVLLGRSGAIGLDSDGDGIGDDLDNCAFVANPGQADVDGDGFGDACDNCIEASNPEQIDTNGDGYGNRCDADVTNDGTINIADLARLRAAFLSRPGLPGWDPDLDFTGDEAVNIAELAIMRSSFLGPPGPSALVP